MHVGLFLAHCAYTKRYMNGENWEIVDVSVGNDQSLWTNQMPVNYLARTTNEKIFVSSRHYQTNPG